MRRRSRRNGRSSDTSSPRRSGPPPVRRPSAAAGAFGARGGGCGRRLIGCRERLGGELPRLPSRPRPKSSPPAPYLRQIRGNHRDAQCRVIARLVEIGKFADGERRDTFRKIAVDARENIDQMATLGLGKTDKGLGANFV